MTLIASPGDCVVRPRFGVIEDARRHQRRRHARAQFALAALAAVLALAAISVRSGPGAPPAVAGTRLAAAVRFTGSPPTGYAVTFRDWAPKASSVQIAGEWYFSSPARTTPWSSQGLLPAQWKPGDFPIAWPNGPYAGWPLISMRKDPRSGIWSYTTPLPAGLYDYHFVLDCTSPELTDPNSTGCGYSTATAEVYVPPDPALHTGDYAWEAPAYPHGALRMLFPSPVLISTAFSGVDALQVYTPPGYDPRRAKPYPTLYVLGSAGTSDVTLAGARGTSNILDNLIDGNAVEPMIVVFAGFAFGNCSTGGWAGYEDGVLNGLLPTIESRYDVSRDPSQRALAGVSCGGSLAASLALSAPTAFAAFGVISPQGELPGAPGARVASLTHARVIIGGGLQDPWHFYATNDLSVLRRAGATPSSDFVDGGHESFVWRELLHDFLTRVPFKAG